MSKSRSINKLDLLFGKKEYSEDEIFDTYCLSSAKQRLGDMFDYGVNIREIPLEKLYHDFIKSGIAYSFECLEPEFVLGRTGQEIVDDIYYELEGVVNDVDRNKPNFADTPEFWLGWFLEEYQWLSEQAFEEITRHISISDILRMYWPYHEMNPRRFYEEMDYICFHERNDEE